MGERVSNEPARSRPSRYFYWVKRLLERHATRLISIQAVGFYIFLYLPIVVMIVLSFNVSRNTLVWRGFTLEWYRRILTGQPTEVVNPDVAWVALQNSLMIGIMATVVSTIFGTMVAFALQRYRYRGRRPIMGLIYMPIIMPSIIMGVSVLIFFRLLDMSTGIRTTMIAHIVFNISFVTVIVYARLANFDETLDEAAMILGANRLETFRYVTLPLITPAIIAGALLAFALSFDDFVITFFVIGTETTIPVFFFGMVRHGVAPGVNVIATLILVALVAIILIAQYIGGTEVFS